MRSAALVAIDGTIDFFCFPTFDSPTIFASLLDSEQGGLFRIEPHMENIRYKQLYLPDTNILITRFLSEEGVAELTDFMPVESGSEGSAYAHQILRRLKVIRGDIRFTVRCAPRFNYARSAHRAEQEEGSVCFRSDSDECHSMALHATIPLDIEGGDAVAHFSLDQGEQASFAFGALDPEEKGPSQILNVERIEKIFHASVEFWRDWIHKASYRGRWREIVYRSALVLKLLSSQQHGSMVAAATFGLPERNGGGRNWDYRYSWLRDASFSLYALVRLGLSSEVQSYGRWMRDRAIQGVQDIGEDGPMRVLYQVDGGEDLQEETLDHLAGYQGSKPVRIGNAASHQLQLDIYGELMDAVYLSNKYGPGMSKDGWHRIIQIMAWLHDNWSRPDEGIWEVRAGRKHLLHSRLMCWVAFDRAIRLADKRSLDAPLHDWYEARRQIDEDIWTNFWDADLNAFVYAKGEKTVDAALLLMPMLRYISPTDPRWLGTLDRIEETLTEDSHVFRYVSGSDGIDGEEGSFVACSFWLIECLARAGRIDKARLLFDKMLGYANHLGLYSEQLGRSGEHLGNFPQALTHLALISAATYLDRAIDGIKEPWS